MIAVVAATIAIVACTGNVLTGAVAAPTKREAAVAPDRAPEAPGALPEVGSSHVPGDATPIRYFRKPWRSLSDFSFSSRAA